MTQRQGRPIAINKEGQPSTSKQAEGLNWDFEGHRHRQARLGLWLTPAERLRWLEQSMDELRKLVGRARQGRPVSPDELTNNVCNSKVDSLKTKGC